MEMHIAARTVSGASRYADFRPSLDEALGAKTPGHLCVDNAFVLIETKRRPRLVGAQVIDSKPIFAR